MTHCSSVLTLALLLPLAACDGVTGDNEIFGSAAKTYNMDFNTVRVKKLVIGGVFNAMEVHYINEVSGKSPVTPVKVIAMAPVEPGKQKSLKGDDGEITRIMPKGGEFPKIEEGNITFSSIEVGSNSSGEWFITFQPETQGSTKTTLNGRFSAEVEQIGDSTSSKDGG